jgi:hypothetical protein
MKGSRDLKFEPAKTQGIPVPVSILLPVFFRHPDAPPLAGDSIIPRDSSTVTKTTDSAASKAPAKAPPGKATKTR